MMQSLTHPLQRKSLHRSRRVKSRVIAAAIMSAACGSVAFDASAASWTRTSAAGVGSWFVNANWSGGFPSGGIEANISNGGTAEINSGTAACGNLYLGE